MRPTIQRNNSGGSYAENATISFVIGTKSSGHVTHRTQQHSSCLPVVVQLHHELLMTAASHGNYRHTSSNDDDVKMVNAPLMYQPCSRLCNLVAPVIMERYVRYPHSFVFVIRGLGGHNIV